MDECSYCSGGKEGGGGLCRKITFFGTEKLWEQTDLTALQFFRPRVLNFLGGPLALRVEVQAAASRGPSPLAPRYEVPWRRDTRSLGAAIRGPLRRHTRSPAPPYEVPCCAAIRGPWGQKKNPKIWGLGHL